MGNGEGAVWVKRLLLLLSPLLFFACLPMRAVCTGNFDCSRWPAYGILLFGWMAPFAAPANIGWWANPMLLISWVMGLQWKYRSAAGAAGAALIFCLIPLVDPDAVMNEGGIIEKIASYRAGYYLWLASAVVNLACLLVLVRLDGQGMSAKLAESPPSG